ncbi:hypothetical protein [Niallia sp. 03133]
MPGKKYIPFIWTALAEIVKVLSVTMMLTIILLIVGFFIGPSMLGRR